MKVEVVMAWPRRFEAVALELVEGATLAEAVAAAGWAGIEGVDGYAVFGVNAEPATRLREGVPRTILEAMSCARPVITTDAPGCRETVIDGDNGFLVPVRDPQALVVAMLKLVRQPELIASMGARSRQMAEERYDVHKVNAAMLRGMGFL